MDDYPVWELKESFQEKVIPGEERWMEFPERGSNINTDMEPGTVGRRGAASEQ